jgi:hypothetical protein
MGRNLSEPRNLAAISMPVSLRGGMEDAEIPAKEFDAVFSPIDLIRLTLPPQNVSLNKLL